MPPPFRNLYVIERGHVKNTPGKAGTTLGHMDFITVEFSGLFNSGVKPKVGIKLFRGRKKFKIPPSLQSGRLRLRSRSHAGTAEGRSDRRSGYPAASLLSHGVLSGACPDASGIPGKYQHKGGCGQRCSEEPCQKQAASFAAAIMASYLRRA